MRPGRRAWGLWATCLLVSLACGACLEGSGYVPDVTDTGMTGSDTDVAQGDPCAPIDTQRDPLTGCPVPAITAPFTGPRAYVTVANSDYVAVLGLCDPANPVVARCVSVDANPEWSDEPYDLAVASDGTWYVTVPHGAGFVNGELWRFASGAVTDPTRTRLTAEPDHVDVTPDGAVAYVTSLRNLEAPFGPYTEPGSLLVLDGTTLEGDQEFRIGLAAADVKVSADSRVVVAAIAGTDELFVYRPESGDSAFVPVGESPTRGQPTYQPFYLELDDTGDAAFVATFRSGDLRRVDLNSGAVTIADLGATAEPRDVARDRARNLLLVTDTANSQLIALDETTLEESFRVSVGPPDVAVGAPFGVAPVPGTAYALVVNSRDPALATEPGAVVVVDLEQRSVVATVPVGLGPRLIEVFVAP